MNQIRRKIDLYLLSLALLFVFLIIITADIPTCLSTPCSLMTALQQLADHFVFFISCLLFIYCFVAYHRFKFDLKGATDIPFEITKISGIHYEHLTFLATYVVPLISFDFDSFRQMIVLGLLLIVMGIIYIKTDLFYANPSLALLGYHIYQANGNFKHENKENIILIARAPLSIGEKVEYIQLDERIYYVKKVSV
jgi:uncharacterized membrane protein